MRSSALSPSQNSRSAIFSSSEVLQIRAWLIDRFFTAADYSISMKNGVRPGTWFYIF